MKAGVVAGLSVLLVVAVIAQFSFRAINVTHATSRLAVVSTGGDSWSSKPIPVGPTEGATAAAAVVLNYDDVFYRQYSSSRGTFALYAAFWSPGKMPTQLVASHTPDRCWSEAGWNCTIVSHAVPVPAHTRLTPAESRTFVTPAGGRQHVVYWHLVGGKLYDYGARFNRVPSAWRWCRDALGQVFRAPPEQYFIRLSSDLPLIEWRGDPAFEAVAASLGQLGLAADVH
jgi:hypothetical protein